MTVMCTGVKVTTMAGQVTYDNVSIEHADGVLTVTRAGKVLLWASQPWLVEFVYS